MTQRDRRGGDLDRVWQVPDAHVDPKRATVGVILTRHLLTGALDGFGDFWAAVADAAA